MEKGYLGTGWSFPPHFDKTIANVSMVSEEEDVRQSLGIIVGTKPFERIVHPDFGCDLSDFQFKSMNLATVSNMKSRVTRAIERYEPRVKVISVDVDTDLLIEGRIPVTVTYRIIDSPNPKNLTFSTEL